MVNKDYEKKTEINYLHNIKYPLIIKKLKEKVKKNKKIRVAFFVLIASTFTGQPLFEKMIEDNVFDPFIVIVPETLREDVFSLSDQDYHFLSKKYKNRVLKGYKKEIKQFFDYSKMFNIIFFPRPYENLTHRFFEIKYLVKKNILTAYLDYAFSVTKYSKEIFKSDFYKYLWRFFLQTHLHYKEYKSVSYLKGKNAVVSGYCKLDNLAKQKILRRKRKTIIIAPHHTVVNWKHLQISTFLQYADFFLKLPLLYPNIDFIFRPHPLLIYQLKRKEIWGKEKTEKYIKKLSSIPNLKFNQNPEYYDIFANSDGIIHDCGSFLAEYLFTEKPACYLLKNESSIKKWFMSIGQRCLENCYLAYSKDDIINFIENVIIKGNDFMKNQRLKFLNSYLKVNYPKASDFIINYLKNILF